MNTEQREASHLNQTDSDAVTQYWKAKEGKCLACNAEIAVQDSYCGACHEFLMEVHAQHQTH